MVGGQAHTFLHCPSASVNFFSAGGRVYPIGSGGPYQQPLGQQKSEVERGRRFSVPVCLGVHL